MHAPTRPQVTDICLITSNFGSDLEFYKTKLGLKLRSYVPGFADFEGENVVVALWDAALLETNTGVVGLAAGQKGHGVMIACELDSPADVDRVYGEYVSRGVEFYKPPADYPWNARCAYFAGPCGEFWELFSWLEGGQPGLV